MNILNKTKRQHSELYPYKIAFPLILLRYTDTGTTSGQYACTLGAYLIEQLYSGWFANERQYFNEWFHLSWHTLWGGEESLTTPMS